MNGLNDLNNRVWAELTVGDEASIERTVTSRELYLFAHASATLIRCTCHTCMWLTPTTRW